MELTERQETILALVIHEFVDNAHPIGSKSVVSKYSLPISPATVRNEMAVLTDAGFLRQPHTSAGRVPTEEGYRFFVRSLLGETELPAAEKRLISHQFHQAPSALEDWIRLATSILAQQSQAASLATIPRPRFTQFKHLELISTQGSQVLLVLVLQGGDVRQQMLTLTETADQARLDDIARQITMNASGKGALDIEKQLPDLSGLTQEVTGLAVEIMKKADVIQAGHIYRDGLSNVISQPEFADSNMATNALRLLEERSFTEDVLSSILSPTIGAVQVVIDGEGAWDELRHCSVIVTRYGDPELATGAIGVIGPVRMSYGRSISAVRYVAGLLSDLVIEFYNN